MMVCIAICSRFFAHFIISPPRTDSAAGAAKPARLPLWASRAWIGLKLSQTGTIATPYHFSGEPLSGDRRDLHVRHYALSLGVFPSRDLFAGTVNRAMGLNGDASPTQSTERAYLPDMV
ncbi:hypothetical protein HC928_10715 [bacterium]|nr:hypothetical protein [bacterium]